MLLSARARVSVVACAPLSAVRSHNADERLEDAETARWGPPKSGGTVWMWGVAPVICTPWPLSSIPSFPIPSPHKPPTQPRLPASASAQGLRNRPAQSRLPRQHSPTAWATDHPQSRRPSPSRLPCRRSPVVDLLRMEPTIRIWGWIDASSRRREVA
jgi:hypothetical protein